MFTNLYVSLSLGLGAWLRAAGGEAFAAVVAPVAVLGIVIAAMGFLFLVARVSWGVRQFVATCQERQRTEGKMVEMLREYLGQQPADLEQMWSASAAMAVC